MKLFLILPFVLLLGLIIGGWEPKEELRTAQREISDLKEKLARREKDSRGDAFTRMVRIPDRAQKSKRVTMGGSDPSRISATDDTRAKNSSGNDLSPAETNITRAQTGSSVTNVTELPPEDLRVRIDEAKELWKTRVDIARAQWIDRLKLSPEATALFDASINAMNENLYTSMQNLAAALETEKDFTAELGTRFFNEMTASLVKTYDDLATFVPETQRGEAAKLELTDFIDPAVGEPLIAVQDKLGNLSTKTSGHRGPRFFR